MAFRFWAILTHTPRNSSRASERDAILPNSISSERNVATYEPHEKRQTVSCNRYLDTPVSHFVARACEVHEVVPQALACQAKERPVSLWRVDARLFHQPRILRLKDAFGRHLRFLSLCRMFTAAIPGSPRNGVALADDMPRGRFVCSALSAASMDAGGSSAFLGIRRALLRSLPCHLYGNRCQPARHECKHGPHSPDVRNPDSGQHNPAHRRAERDAGVERSRLQ